MYISKILHINNYCICLYSKRISCLQLVAISEFHLIELSKCCELKGDMLTPHHIAHVYTLRVSFLISIIK